jgi:hypothetical protein
MEPACPAPGAEHALAVDPCGGSPDDGRTCAARYHSTRGSWTALSKGYSERRTAWSFPSGPHRALEVLSEVRVFWEAMRDLAGDPSKAAIRDELAKVMAPCPRTHADRRARDPRGGPVLHSRPTPDAAADVGRQAHRSLISRSVFRPECRLPSAPSDNRPRARAGESMAEEFSVLLVYERRRRRRRKPAA